MNSLAISFLVSCGVCLLVGYSAGARFDQASDDLKIEQERRAALWDAAFLADLDATPSDREAMCDRIIEDVRDMLSSEMVEDAPR